MSLFCVTPLDGYFCLVAILVDFPIFKNKTSDGFYQFGVDLPRVIHLAMFVLIANVISC